MRKIKLFPYFFLFFLALSTNSIKAQEVEDLYKWPKEIKTENETVITLYQPQLESFEGITLEGRMAVTVNHPQREIMFGAVWFKATMETDKEARMVLLKKMSILKTHFPDAVDPEKSEEFGKLLAAEIESWDMEMSLDRITASLDEVNNLKEQSDKINNEPPTIYLRKNPAVLVVIDGEPIVKEYEDSKIDFVVNTTFFIVKESKKDQYYLNGGQYWYTSKDILSGWEETTKIPSKIKKFAKDNLEDAQNPDEESSFDVAPELIVVTKPSELVLLDGEPDYKTVDGTNLLYVDNTENDILMDINTQNHYLLLAGRWYYATSLESGDWKFQEPYDLPEDFKAIPEDSPMASVRASIPGTPEAQTALLEQSIPQTATIDRKTASLEVTYDGEPEFEKIEGTSMSYAKNTSKSVLLIESTYYAVEDGVWFESTNAKGPWVVSTERPDEVDNLPPDCPVYNVKYVYIYDSTPEVVYVGYYPGYNYSYVYHGVVVYGTGYYYYPWYRYYYYPRAVTWGFGVHWNPWTGWGFHFGIRWGWIGWGFHPYRRGYWGARGYRAGYRRGYARGYARGRYHANRPRPTPHSARNRNVYNNRANGVKNTANNRARTNNNINNKARASNKANNMYSDRSGNVYQRNNSGGFDNKTRQSPSTNNRAGQGQTRQSSPSTNQNRSNSQQNLNRSYQNRSQGTSNYNRSRSYSGNRSGGSYRGGGGRRR